MDEVRALLKNHPNLSIKEDEGGKCKVVCELTSHEMPCTTKAIEMYVNGKKYKHACEHKLTSKEKELCSQYLVDKRSGRLYCKLTKRHLNNLPHHIRQHLKGRRFQKVLNNMNGTNTTQEKTKQQEKIGKDEDTEIWVPPDSESESEETEGLDPEFEEEKVVECPEEEHDYTFDVLNAEETPLEENDKEMSNKKEGGKTKLKRPATASSGQSKKKGKKSQKKSNETPKKKKKKT